MVGVGRGAEKGTSFRRQDQKGKEAYSSRGGDHLFLPSRPSSIQGTSGINGKDVSIDDKLSETSCGETE